MKTLDDYREIIGEEALTEIHEKARNLQEKRIIHINSTSHGGGVAEILSSLVPLMNDAGIQAEWRVIQGPPDFYNVTKSFHNALQGSTVDLDEGKTQLWIQTNEAFSSSQEMEVDCVIVHDPQPLPLIQFFDKKEPWVWRCHVDISNPNAMLWDILTPYIEKYDTFVISSKIYEKENLSVKQRIIHPAIDPLSPKNMELTTEQINNLVGEAGVPLDKPLVTQVSRMDLWKDPEGLLGVFDKVKQEVDCRLLYCFSSSVDDPEGAEVFTRTYRKAQKYIESGDVIFVEGNNQLLVNAIQRASTVLVQKSIKEGFCLCVTEALWKAKPVVATNVGGIPLQLREAESGFLVDPRNGEKFADKVIHVLQNPDMAKQMGEKGKEVVRKEFLITRLLMDYLDLFSSVMGRDSQEPLTLPSLPVFKENNFVVAPCAQIEPNYS